MLVRRSCRYLYRRSPYRALTCVDFIEAGRTRRRGGTVRLSDTHRAYFRAACVLRAATSAALRMVMTPIWLDR